MAHPMFALLVDTDPEIRQRILDGRKSISIRRGHKDYGVGAKLMLSCHRIPWAALATITSVRHTTFHALRTEELMDDGFLNHDLAMIGLKKYYPNLNQYTAMTVIRWRDVEGFFVRHAVQHRSHPTALYRSIPEYYRQSITLCGGFFLLSYEEYVTLSARKRLHFIRRRSIKQGVLIGCWNNYLSTGLIVRFSST